MVEVVDENLNILDTVSKQEAHEKGLLHKCVVAKIIVSASIFSSSENTVLSFIVTRIKFSWTYASLSSNNSSDLTCL